MVDRTTSTEWFTSSWTTNAEACVEVRFDGDEVLVRDTKDHGHGPVLSVPVADWPGFLADVRNDHTNTTAPLRIDRTPDGGAHVSRPGDPVILTYTAREWDAFVHGVRDGEFDPGMVVLTRS